MAERARVNESADQAKTASKAVKDTEKVKVDAPIHKVARTSEEEVTDEVCPDSEYVSEAPPDKSKAISKPPEVPPSPVRDQTLGGIDYLLSYDYPIFDDTDFAC